MENTDEIVKNFPKGDPFKTPDGYFEYLPGKISERIHQETKPVAQISFWRQPLKVAASFAILAVVSYSAFVFINSGNSNKTQAIAEINDTLSEEYALMDENSIIHYMVDPSLVQTEANTDTMIEFLVDQDVSYELLADYY